MIYNKIKDTIKSKPFEFGTFTIAIISLLFSAYGIYIADSAQSYTESVEGSRRSIVLIGDTGEHEKSLKLTPLQSGMIFLSGKAYFPTEIIEDAVLIDTGGQMRWTDSLMHNLEKIAQNNMSPEDDYIVISEGGIPIVIYSYYAFEGKSYEDWSLYNLLTQTIIKPSENGGKYFVSLKSVIFGSRLNAISEEGVERVPDTIWNAMKSQGLGSLEIPITIEK